MSRAKVQIGFPVGGSVHPAFCKALLDLQRFELLEPSPDYELLPVEYSASLYVQENRNRLVDLARSRGADWLLQLDTDESFPAPLLRSFMAWANAAERPIVVGLYANVMLAPEATQGGFYAVDMVYRELPTGEYESIQPPATERPFQVDAAGSGALLTHLSVFDRLEEPYFWLELIQPTNRDKPQIMNEDIAFCRRVREAGFQIWCVPSPEITHYKSLALVPSTFRAFMERARRAHQEMAAGASNA